MSEWFRCRCGEAFDTETADRRETFERSEFWGAVEIRRVDYLVCPACAGEEFEEFAPCATCQAEGLDPPAEAVDGADDCPDHLEAPRAPELTLHEEPKP